MMPSRHESSAILGNPDPTGNRPAYSGNGNGFDAWFLQQAASQILKSALRNQSYSMQQYAVCTMDRRLRG